MPDYVQSLGECIKRARITKGMTQIQLAERIGVDQRTIINIENYRGNPKFEVLFPLIRELDIDPWEVFYPEKDSGAEAMRQLRIILRECTEGEIDSLLPICRAALDVIKAKDSLSIK